MTLPPPGTSLACCVAAVGVGLWGIAAYRLRRGEPAFAEGPAVTVAGWGVPAGVAAFAGALLVGPLLPGPVRSVGTAALFAAAAAFVWMFARRPEGPPRPLRSELTDAAFLFPLGVAAAGAGFAASLPWRTDAGANPLLVALLEDGSAAAWAVTFLSAVLCAPVGEEVLFRGLFQGALRSARWPAWAAVGASSAAFCLWHSAVQDWPALALLALTLGWAREATGSLVPGALAHAGFNALMLCWVLLDTAAA